MSFMVVKRLLSVHGVFGMNRMTDVKQLVKKS